MALRYATELGAFDRIKNYLAFQVRRRTFERFMQECAPGPEARVADFGVSGHRDHPVHYFFESLYPHREQLTVIGRAAEEAGWFAEAFPGLRFLEADLREIPLPDGYFDYGICNAVVEHAGTRGQQRALVAEVCRVCRCVLITTPNKWFPLELHTWLPLADKPAGWAPGIAPQIGAAVWPIGLLLSVEVLSRVPWPRGWAWSLARYGGAGTVALGSAVISYGHLRDVLLAWGYGPMGAHVGPLVLDGLMVISGFALLAMSSHDKTAKQ